ncbi:hypothetical protein GWI34_40680, partial [Actinomadura sp. DSM 109109]|nr:hypothetical protein [Actinomadura lepetitiana]
MTIFEGLILVSLMPERAPDPETMLRHVRPFWSRYELASTRTAAIRHYRLQGNWKLGIENNLECYHCLPSHPEYTTTNAFVRADEQTSETVVESFAAYRKLWEERMRAAGTLTGRSEMITTRGQP